MRGVDVRKQNPIYLCSERMKFIYRGGGVLGNRNPNGGVWLGGLGGLGGHGVG